MVALSAWLDGELEAGRAAALEAHVAGCAVCRERAEGLRATRAQVRALGLVEPPRSFRITPAMVVDARPGRRPTAAVARWAPALSAAAAVVFAVVVVADVRSAGGGTSSGGGLTFQSAKGPALQRAATASGANAPAPGAAGAENGFVPPAVGTGAAAGAAAPATPTAGAAARKDAGPAAGVTSVAAYDSAAQRTAGGGSGGSRTWLHIVEGAIAAVAVAAAGVAIGGRRMARGARQ
ncbi:MAG TPA: zf-HC2 domain-containing protein [Dehalococcoidia bacterium]|nr:zf-HC2 domain-containing protein [Dehalococcoidia bacterium]